MTHRSPIGWHVQAWHDWDSFLPRCDPRDFTLVKLGGEWNHMTERVEAEICLLGLWLRVTYVWSDAFACELQARRDAFVSGEFDEGDFGGAPTQEGE